ncbi:hypothetical protein GZH46_01579, partial [Fragariocoptes setiger]
LCGDRRAPGGSLRVLHLSPAVVVFDANLRRTSITVLLIVVATFATLAESLHKPSTSTYGPIVRPRPEDVVPFPRSIQLFACEGDRLQLLCPALHKIQILIGLYAKNYTAADQCRGKNGILPFTYPPDHESYCNQELTVAAFQRFLSKKCNDQPNCEFRVWTNDFGINPNMCHEYPRAAELAYRCMPTPEYLASKLSSTTSSISSVPSSSSSSIVTLPSTTAPITNALNNKLGTTTLDESDTTTIAPVVGYPIRPSRFTVDLLQQQNTELSAPRVGQSSNDSPNIQASRASGSSQVPTPAKQHHFIDRPALVTVDESVVRTAPVQYEEPASTWGRIRSVYSSMNNYIMNRIVTRRAAKIRAQRSDLEKSAVNTVQARPPHALLYDDASFL